MFASIIVHLTCQLLDVSSVGNNGFMLYDKIMRKKLTSRDGCQIQCKTTFCKISFFCQPIDDRFANVAKTKMVLKNANYYFAFKSVGNVVKSSLNKAISKGERMLYFRKYLFELFSKGFSIRSMHITCQHEKCENSHQRVLQQPLMSFIHEKSIPIKILYIITNSKEEACRDQEA
jgi:hypothetical protein